MKLSPSTNKFVFFFSAAKIIMDKLRRRPKGYAYVSFAKEDEARNALMEMNGKVNVDTYIVWLGLGVLHLTNGEFKNKNVGLLTCRWWMDERFLWTLQCSDGLCRIHGN